MLIKHTSNKDCLNREQDIQFFTSLLDTITEPYVMSLEAPWGSGKSFFIELWEKHLSNNHYRCITFNAWENDFTKDPFLTIIGELSVSIETREDIPSEIKEKFNTVKKHATPIAKHLLKSVVKVTTGISLDLEDTGIERAIGDGVANISGSYLEQYQESKKSISKFKESLQEFADEIKASTGNPLVIFIDELDRCRPNYTISLLEAIKHFFYTTNIIFILAVDRKALKNSVASVFSSEIDVDSYLRKFVDMSLNLPIRNIEQYTKSIAIKTFSINEYEVINLFAKLSNLSHSNLRTIEQSLAFINMLIVTKYQGETVKQELACFLIALKSYYPKRYELLKKKKSFDLLMEINLDIDFKNLLKKENYLYATLIGSTIPQSKYNLMLTVFTNAFLPKGQEPRTTITNYDDIPFNEKKLYTILHELEMDINSVKNLLHMEHTRNINPFSTLLFDVISDIEFIESYTINF